MASGGHAAPQKLDHSGTAMAAAVPDAVGSTESKQPAIIAVSVALPVVAALAVALRLYTRLFILQLTGPDDWLIVVALGLAVATSIETLLQAHWGMGLHIWTVTPELLLKQMKALYADILTYNLANNVIKMSFLLQYRRIFGSSSPTADRVCKWLFFFVLLWAVVQAVLLGLCCIPVATVVPSMAGKCLNTLPVWYTSSVMNITTDFIIFLVPLPCVYNMTLRTKQKILVLSIFSLGFFTCIISIIRLVYLHIVTSSEDPTWDYVELTLWSVAELNCGILCASLQTLRPLLSKCIPGLAFSGSNEGRVRGGLFRNVHNGILLEESPRPSPNSTDPSTSMAGCPITSVANARR